MSDIKSPKFLVYNVIDKSLTCVKTYPSFVFLSIINQYHLKYQSISLNVFTISSLLLFEMAKVIDSLL